MNERIKLLAEQAIEERLTLDEFIDALKKEPYDFYGFRRHELEKFAELIVRGCAMKANATALDLRNYPELNGRKYVGDCILKCFGVEE